MGEITIMTKIDNEDMEYIKHLRSMGYSQIEIAKEVGLTQARISQIFKNLRNSIN